MPLVSQSTRAGYLTLGWGGVVLSSVGALLAPNGGTVALSALSAAFFGCITYAAYRMPSRVWVDATSIHWVADGLERARTWSSVKSVSFWIRGLTVIKFDDGAHLVVPNGIADMDRATLATFARTTDTHY